MHPSNNECTPRHPLTSDSFSRSYYLVPNPTTNSIKGFDLIVLGLQESTYGTSWFSKSCVSELLDNIADVLGSSWVQVQHAKRAQMQMVMYCRKSVRGRITRTEIAVENTGFLHVLPNKGGILVTCYVDGTSLAFISTHLAAHEGVKKCAVRNESTQEILGGVRAGDMTLDPSVQFHHTFLMGDMNYRVTFDPAVPDRAFTDRMGAEEAAVEKLKSIKSMKEELEEEYEDTDERRDQLVKLYHIIETEDWERMLAMDELNREIKAGRILKGFTALQPDFPPTFKRKRVNVIQQKLIGQTLVCGKKSYDVFSSENANATAGTTTDMFYDKKRLPSYTDRILHCSMPGFTTHLKNTHFTSCEKCTSSDHKPVKAHFEVETVEDLKDLKVTSSKRGVQIQIFNLKGGNLAEMDTMAFGGGSDPYIVVSTDPKEVLVQENLRSKTILHDLNPVWDDEMVVTLVSPDLDGLAKRTHLLLNVWDADVISQDDLIGTLSISLDDIKKACTVNGAISQEAQYTFSGPLLANGLVQGELSGAITMSVPKFDESLCVSYSTTTHANCCTIS